jgi:DNA-binding MarR family transcriptional regulator
MDDQRRRYYKLTAEGERVARAESARYQRTAQAALAKGLLLPGRVAL